MRDRIGQGKSPMLKWMACAVFLVLFAAVLPGSAQAASSSDFVVKAVLPDNQADTDNTYFDLKMEQGQKQAIELQLENTGSSQLTLHVALNAASTGRNGLVVYNQPGVRDESMELSIEDVATIRTPEVTLRPGERTSVYTDIQMPEDAVDGILLGGFFVTADQPDDAIPAAGEGVTISNNFAYVVGLQLTQSGLMPEPDFHLVSIEPGLVNHHTSLLFTLQNPKALLTKNMKVEGWVYQQGADSPMRELTLENAQMAPNSSGVFVIDWDSQQLKAGDYRLKLRVEYSGRVWEWDEAFQIGAGEAQSNNQNAVGIQQSPFWRYLFLAVFLLLVIAMVAYWLGKRRSDREEQRPAM